MVNALEEGFDSFKRSDIDHMQRHKVLVVDDSAFMRKLLQDIIESDPAFEVTATARNGREALEKLRSIEVDAITLDVEMPEMNGLEALDNIMKTRPLPVLMVSSLTGEGTRGNHFGARKRSGRCRLKAIRFHFS